MIDVNDTPPQFTNLPNTTTVLENAVNVQVFDVDATDPDVGTGGFVMYSFSEVSGFDQFPEQIYSLVIPVLFNV